VSRDSLVRLTDMLDAAERIAEYTRGLRFEEFVADRRTFDAVVRNLEIVGEAAKGVAEPVRRALPTVPFGPMSGMRDVLIHGYHGVDDQLVWDAASRVLPPAAAAIREYLRTDAR
jgi:uncharacterized protein with HEPN domain